MSEEKIIITAQENDVGKRLDAFASEKTSFTRARIQKMLEDGFEPEVFSSSNVDGGDAVNEAYLNKYRDIIKSL